MKLRDFFDEDLESSITILFFELYAASFCTTLLLKVAPMFSFFWDNGITLSLLIYLYEFLKIKPYFFGRSLDPSLDIFSSCTRQKPLVDRNFPLRLYEWIVGVIHVADLWRNLLRSLFFLVLVFV